MDKITKLLILIIFSMQIFGCVSYQSAATTTPKREASGVYHKVRPKETLWKISKVYNVSLDEIVRANRIPDATKITRGQLIFIPESGRVLDVGKASREISKASSFIWPVKGKVLSYFGEKVAGRENNGIDIKASTGENVYASRSGKVSFLGELKGYGKTLIIEHRDNFSTVYANIVEPKVKIKHSISQGDVIAKTAASNKWNHSFIHFEIRRGYSSQNPIFYLP